MDKIALYQDWLQKKPGDRFATYSLALELAKAERSDEALETFVALLRTHPTSGAGHYQHGLLLQRLGRDDDARVAWEAGLAALEGVDDPEARRSLREIEGALDGL